MIEADIVSEKRVAGFIAEFCRHAEKSDLSGDLESLAEVYSTRS